MHVDLDLVGKSEHFQSTVCIVGGGIAGLILAMRLAKKGVAVHLLEAGGLSPESRSQALYCAEMGSEIHRGANDGRFRTFGGSSTEWGGQILPFTADVFCPPEGSSSIPWPIGEAELTPYYGDVQNILGVDSLPFDQGLLLALGRPAPSASPDFNVRFTKWAPFQQRNLARTLGPEALKHPGITVFSHANAVRFDASEADPANIESVSVLNYARTEFRFTAAQFVLCAGTVESSRLLLCSPDVPNPHDQIGRYFHDHVAYHAAQLESPARERAIEMYGPFYFDGTMHSAQIEASASLRAREHLLAVMAHLVILEPENSGPSSVRNLLRSLQQGNVKQAVASNLLPALRGIADVVRLLYHSRFKHRRAVSSKAVLKLNIDVEQAPHPDNRIRLSETQTDALGLPLTVVDWQVRFPEQDTAARYANLVGEYMKAAGLDTVEWTKSATENQLPSLLDTNHMMGGLRMGNDAAESVVDRDLKVHGLNNLHVASCAVFPSGSSSNPTFTMMALTLRLADLLASRCA